MGPLNLIILLLLLLFSPVATAFNYWEFLTTAATNLGIATFAVGFGAVTCSVVSVSTQKAYYHFFQRKAHLYPNDVFEDPSSEGNDVLPDDYPGKPVTTLTFSITKTNDKFPMATTSTSTNTLVYTGDWRVMVMDSEVEISTDVPPLPYNKCPRIPFPEYFTHNNLCPAVDFLESLGVKPTPVKPTPVKPTTTQTSTSQTGGNVPTLLAIARLVDQYTMPTPQLYPMAAAQFCMFWLRESLPVHLSALRLVPGAIIEAWNIWLCDLLLECLFVLLQFSPRAIIAAWNYWPIFWAINLSLGVLIQILPFILTNASERYYQAYRTIHEKVAEWATRAYEERMKELEHELKVLRLEEEVEEFLRQKKLRKARRDAELQTTIDLEEDQRKLVVATNKANLRDAVQNANLRGCNTLTGGQAGEFMPTEMGEDYWNPGPHYYDNDDDDNEDGNDPKPPARRNLFGSTAQRFDSASIDGEYSNGSDTEDDDDDNQPSTSSIAAQQSADEYGRTGLDGRPFSTAPIDQEHFTPEDIPKHLRGFDIPSTSLISPMYQPPSVFSEADASSSAVQITDEREGEGNQSSLEQVQPPADTSSILEPNTASSPTVGGTVVDPVESELTIDTSSVLGSYLTSSPADEGTIINTIEPELTTDTPLVFESNTTSSPAEGRTVLNTIEPELIATSLRDQESQPAPQSEAFSQLSVDTFSDHEPIPCSAPADESAIVSTIDSQLVATPLHDQESQGASQSETIPQTAANVSSGLESSTTSSLANESTVIASIEFQPPSQSETVQLPLSSVLDQQVPMPPGESKIYNISQDHSTQTTNVGSEEQVVDAAGLHEPSVFAAADREPESLEKTPDSAAEPEHNIQATIVAEHASSVAADTEPTSPEPSSVELSSAEIENKISATENENENASASLLSAENEDGSAPCPELKRSPSPSVTDTANQNDDTDTLLEQKLFDSAENKQETSHPEGSEQNPLVIDDIEDDAASTIVSKHVQHSTVLTENECQQAFTPPAESGQLIIPGLGNVSSFAPAVIDEPEQQMIPSLGYLPPSQLDLMDFTPSEPIPPLPMEPTYLREAKNQELAKYEPQSPPSSNIQARVILKPRLRGRARTRVVSSRHYEQDQVPSQSTPTMQEPPLIPDNVASILQQIHGSQNASPALQAQQPLPAMDHRPMATPSSRVIAQASGEVPLVDEDNEDEIFGDLYAFNPVAVPMARAPARQSPARQSPGAPALPSPQQAMPLSATEYRGTGDEDSDGDDDRSQSSKSTDDGEEGDGVMWVDCFSSQPALQGGKSEGLEAIIDSMGDVALGLAPEDAMDIVNEEEEMDTDDVLDVPGDLFEAQILEYMETGMDNSPDEENLVLNIHEVRGEDGDDLYIRYEQEAVEYMDTTPDDESRILNIYGVRYEDGDDFLVRWEQEPLQFPERYGGVAHFQEEEHFDDGDHEMEDVEPAPEDQGREIVEGALDYLINGDLLPIFQQMPSVNTTIPDVGFEVSVSELLEEEIVFPDAPKNQQATFAFDAPAPQDNAFSFNDLVSQNDAFSFAAPATENNAFSFNHSAPQAIQGTTTTGYGPANEVGNFNFDNTVPQNTLSGYAYADEIDNADTSMSQDAFSGYDAAGQQQPLAQNTAFQEQLESFGLDHILAFNQNFDAANGTQAAGSAVPQNNFPGYGVAGEQQPPAENTVPQEDLFSTGLNFVQEFNQNFGAANGDQPSNGTMSQNTSAGYGAAEPQQLCTQNSATQDEFVGSGLDLLLAFNQNFDAANGNQPPIDWQENPALGHVDLAPGNASEEILQDQAQTNNASEQIIQEQSQDNNASQARLQEMSREDLEEEINNDLLQEYEADSVYDDEISRTVRSPPRSDCGIVSDDDDRKTVYDYESDDLSELSSAGSELDRRPPHEIFPHLFPSRQGQEQRASIPGLSLEPQADEDREAEDDAQSDTSSIEPPENPDDWEKPGYLRERIERALQRIEPAPNSLIPRMEINQRTGLNQFRTSWVLENPAFLRTMAGQNYLRGNPQFAIDHCWEVVNRIKRIRKAEKAARKERGVN